MPVSSPGFYSMYVLCVCLIISMCGVVWCTKKRAPFAPCCSGHTLCNAHTVNVRVCARETINACRYFTPPNKSQQRVCVYSYRM